MGVAGSSSGGLCTGTARGSAQTPPKRANAAVFISHPTSLFTQTSRAAATKAPRAHQEQERGDPGVANQRTRVLHFPSALGLRAPAVPTPATRKEKTREAERAERHRNSDTPKRREAARGASQMEDYSGKERVDELLLPEVRAVALVPQRVVMHGGASLVVMGVRAA